MRPEFPSFDQRHAGWLHRCTLLALVALMASTWRLWTPQQAFPQVPLVSAVARGPLALQWGAHVFLAGALLTSIFAPWKSRLSQIGGYLTLAAIGTLIVFDQQRLQAWTYEILIIELVLLAAPAAAAQRWLQVLVISIYVYSAGSKLDALFLNTTGQSFLGALFGPVRVAQWPGSLRWALAMMFPASELLLAGLLFAPRTRRIGLSVSIVMHLMLIVVLGPWGLRHQLGVLLWNLFFVVQNVLLFGFGSGTHQSQSVDRFGRRFAKGTIVTVIILPLLEPWGWCDHWLAWGLYSPRAERVTVLLPESMAERLNVVRPYLAPATVPGMVQLQLDRWSQDVLAVPIYPQARLQLALAKGVARAARCENSIVVYIEQRPSRRSVDRPLQQCVGLDQLEMASRQYWFGSAPSEHWVAAHRVADE